MKVSFSDERQRIWESSRAYIRAERRRKEASSKSIGKEGDDESRIDKPKSGKRDLELFESHRRTGLASS